MAKHARTRDNGHAGGARRTHDIATLAAGVIEPALRRRAGLNMAVAANWPAIVGPALAGHTRPIRIRWARRPVPGERSAPGTLVIACSGAAALRVQHEADQIVERVNAAFGHDAIGRVRIEQTGLGEQTGSGEQTNPGERAGRPARAPRAVRPRDATSAERRRAEALAGTIAHERLRHALSRLGERVIVASASTSPSNLHDHTIASHDEIGSDREAGARSGARRGSHGPDERTEHDA